jgi:uncharacterized membrane-anchored protein YhcB (DUF1043 family)
MKSEFQNRIYVILIGLMFILLGAGFYWYQLFLAPLFSSLFFIMGLQITLWAVGIKSEFFANMPRNNFLSTVANLNPAAEDDDTGSGKDFSQTAREAEKHTDAPPWLILSMFLVMTLVLLILYGWSVASTTLLLIELLVGVASMTLGCFLGFLFGIPRTIISSETEDGNNAATRTMSYRPNTNLEQISDWLTKILIGIGLVELGDISETLTSISRAVTASVEGAPSGAGVATQIVIVIFLVFGFVVGFLWTRIYYGPLQTITDINLQDKLREIRTELSEQKERAEVNESITKKIAAGTLVTATPSLTSEEKVPELEAVTSESLPLNVQEKLEAFRNAPRKWDSDPAAEYFPGFSSQANGRKLSARIDAKMENALVIALRAERIDGEPLEDEVIFLLHPTLRKRLVYVTPKDDKAEVDFYAEGWFTVVAILDNGKTILSYDLRKVDGAPLWFKKN